MIVQRFDYGWGPEWPMKSLETEILRQYLQPLEQSEHRVVVINSTWYGQYQHAKTLRWLRHNEWDRLILVAMIDAPIPQADWFAEFDRPVDVVGSYPGDNGIVFWAQVIDQYYQRKNFNEANAIDTPFMCLNRKPHWHRKKLYQQLCEHDLVNKGLVTMGHEGTGPAERRITESVSDNNLAPNGSAVQHGIPNDITSLGDDTNWARCLLNIVTETVWDISKTNFVSEKIFKPIIGQRPFLVYDSDGAVTWLQQHGFRTYVEDFRDICDLDLAVPENITPFLSVLCQQNTQYLRSKFVDLWPKIQYNQQRLDGFIQEQKIKIQKGIACQI
jgi:hypothetical protein